MLIKYTDNRIDKKPRPQGIKEEGKMSRMTLEEKDTKYGPVFDLMVKAREAHAALTKAKKGEVQVSPEDVAKVKAAAETADKAVQEAQESYGLDDIKILLSYAGQAIFSDATVNGKLNSKKALWLTKALLSVKDERHLPREDKDKAAKKYSLAEYRVRSLEAFIRGAGEVNWTPRRGMTDSDVRTILGRLDRKFEEFRKSSKRLSADRVKDLAEGLRRSVPRNWLEERQARPQQTQGLANIGKTAKVTKGGAKRSKKK